MLEVIDIDIDIKSCRERLICFFYITNFYDHLVVIKVQPMNNQHGQNYNSYYRIIYDNWWITDE